MLLTCTLFFLPRYFNGVCFVLSFASTDLLCVFSQIVFVNMKYYLRTIMVFQVKENREVFVLIYVFLYFLSRICLQLEELSGLMARRVGTE